MGEEDAPLDSRRLESTMPPVFGAAVLSPYSGRGWKAPDGGTSESGESPG